MIIICFLQRSCVEDGSLRPLHIKPSQAHPNSQGQCVSENDVPEPHFHSTNPDKS